MVIPLTPEALILREKKNKRKTMMKIKTKLTIEGETVYPVLEVGDIEIYQDGDDNSFIIRGGVVICWAEFVPCHGEGGGGGVTWKIPKEQA
jgi:hypothetical protein